MRPELINRFDAIVTFRALTRNEVGKIFDNLIAELDGRLLRKGIHLSVNSAAKKLVIKEGYSEKFGARPLRRVIQDKLEHQIADGILAGTYEKGTVLKIGARKGEVVVDVEYETAQ